MNLKDKILKGPWPYWLGAVILAILNIFLLFTTGAAWRISSSFLYIGIGLLDKLGININHWYYIRTNKLNLAPGETYFKNSFLIISMAIIIGSLISVLANSQFKLKKVKNKKQLGLALLGGILMGYGTRLAFGCNIGAYFSAIPSMSLHGWLFGIFTFVGAWIGGRILVRYII